jgi:hypothetical protein
LIIGIVGSTPMVIAVHAVKASAAKAAALETTSLSRMGTDRCGRASR